MLTPNYDKQSYLVLRLRFFWVILETACLETRFDYSTQNFKSNILFTVRCPLPSVYILISCEHCMISQVLFLAV